MALEYVEEYLLIYARKKLFYVALEDKTCPCVIL